MMRHLASTAFLTASLVLGPGCPDDTGGSAGPDPDAFPTVDPDVFVPWTDAVSDEGRPVNVPPTPPKVHLEPADPLTADAIVLLIDEPATDPDGGPEPIELLISWYKDDTLTPHGAMEIPSAVTRRGDVWRVEVRASDGLDQSEPATAEVWVINSPPVLDSVGIEPLQPDLESVLHCVAGLRSDPDDDAVSLVYGWMLDGEPLEGVTTLALAPPLEAERSYQCWAAPFDGELYGDEVTSNPVVPHKPAEELKAILRVFPKAVDCGTVTPEEIGQGHLLVTNDGDLDLEITEAELSGYPGFALADTLPITVPPVEEQILHVTFQTDEPGLKKGNLKLATNAVNPNTGIVPLVGIGAAPCLQVTPSELDFGAVYVPNSNKAVIELSSCGTMPAVVTAIDIDPASGTPFVPDLLQGGKTLPWSIEPGETVEVDIYFKPTKPSPIDDEGVPHPDEATLSITVDKLPEPFQVSLVGFGTDLLCPVPVITADVGGAYTPWMGDPKKGVQLGSTIHLSAAQSIGIEGMPTSWHWSVIPAFGFEAVPIQPSDDAVDIWYPLDHAGVYVFELTVEDVYQPPGKPPVTVPGCYTQMWAVRAREELPIRIEMMWNAPGDPDQNDIGPGTFTDLDLHLVNSQGTSPDYDGDGKPDAWFDFYNDCFWVSKKPDWGTQGSKQDDPVLVLQDDNGVGPEIIEFGYPLAGETYKFGIHYWIAHDFGPATVHVKIALFEDDYQVERMATLKQGDLWIVGSITWPAEHVTFNTIPGVPENIIHDYPNPFWAD